MTDGPLSPLFMIMSRLKNYPGSEESHVLHDIGGCSNQFAALKGILVFRCLKCPFRSLPDQEQERTNLTEVPAVLSVPTRVPG